MVRLWRNAWEEFTPSLDYDVEIRTMICSTNAIESLVSLRRDGACIDVLGPSSRARSRCRTSSERRRTNERDAFEGVFCRYFRVPRRCITRGSLTESSSGLACTSTCSVLARPECDSVCGLHEPARGHVQHRHDTVPVVSCAYPHRSPSFVGGVVVAVVRDDRRSRHGHPGPDGDHRNRHRADLPVRVRQRLPPRTPHPNRRFGPRSRSSPVAQRH